MQGRPVLLKVVGLNLAAGHRITRILHVLKIPTSTYYDSLNWQPSKTAIRRQMIKEKVLEYWLKFPMYGYPRLTILLNKKFQFGVGTGLIYKLMCELGIQSRMIKKWKKAKTHTTVEQRPNLIKTLSDKSTVLLTEAPIIRVRENSSIQSISGHLYSANLQ
ncbi:transposase (fragment) [Carnobacterium maltaromaticum]